MHVLRSKQSAWFPNAQGLVGDGLPFGQKAAKRRRLIAPTARE